MIDERELFERAAGRFDPPTDAWDRLHRRRDRKRRNQRVAAGALSLALVAAGLGVVISVLRDADRPLPGGGSNQVVRPEIVGPCFEGDPCFDTDIYRIRVDGSEFARLGTDPARDIAFSVSADDARIAFHRVEGDSASTSTADIYTMTFDGTDVRRLTDDPAIDGFPAFSPDGTQIAFASGRAGTFDIFVMNADGTDVVRVTEFQNDGLDDLHPTWSPDGTRIAFIRGLAPPGKAGRLWVMDADGSDGHVLLDEPLVGFPAWSPDGTRIAFQMELASETRIGVLELATGNVLDLGPGALPRWSPDSSRLAISDVGGGIEIIDLADESRTFIAGSGDAPVWSPDGRWIVFNDAGLTAGGKDAAKPVLQAPSPGEAIAGFTESGIPFLVVRHSDGTLTAVEAVSPHLATGDVRKLLGWCVSSRTFDDKFHGARFDEFGRYVSGPSPSGLVPLSVEVVTGEPPTFRLGDRLPALPRDGSGQMPTGPLCMDLEATPLVAPDIAESGLTPEELAASSPTIGSRWSIEGTLLVSPGGEAWLCASYVDDICEAGAPVTGPIVEGEDELVVEGTWFVIVQDGQLVDPIRAA